MHHATRPTVYIYQDSKLLVPVVYFAEPVKNRVGAPFGPSNMHSTLDFCPKTAKKETNVALT